MGWPAVRLYYCFVSFFANISSLINDDVGRLRFSGFLLSVDCA